MFSIFQTAWTFLTTLPEQRNTLTKLRSLPAKTRFLLGEKTKIHWAYIVCRDIVVFLLLKPVLDSTYCGSLTIDVDFS